MSEEVKNIKLRLNCGVDVVISGISLDDDPNSKGGILSCVPVYDTDSGVDEDIIRNEIKDFLISTLEGYCGSQ